MSAFQSYAGAYEFDGGDFAWRCYSTTPVYEVRRSEHAPFPSAPNGRKWVLPDQSRHSPDVACLIDAAVEEFSQILLQVEATPRVIAQPRQAMASA